MVQLGGIYARDYAHPAWRAATPVLLLPCAWVLRRVRSTGSARSLPRELGDAGDEPAARAAPGRLRTCWLAVPCRSTAK